MIGDSITFEDADSDNDETLSQEELQALTIAQIRAIAREKGYTLSGTTKADLIASFLVAQNA